MPAPKSTPATAPAAPLATPENTPVPGGGRWKWNATSGAWDAVAEPDAPALEPIPE